MSRVTPVYAPGDHPKAGDPAVQGELAELFGYLFPNVEKPEIDPPHTGLAIAAQNPKLALQLAKMSRFMVLELPWCQRRDRLELAIQAVNLHFKSDFSFQARLPQITASGLGLEKAAAIPYWRTTPLFDAEERLVVEYAFAAAAGDVPAELFARVAEQYGEQGAVEFTSVVAWFSFWAMLINAVRPELAGG